MKFSKLALALGSALLCFGAYAGIPNTDDPTTFVGPTARLSFTNTMTDTTAYSINGEAGLKNFRVGGTLGWKIAEDQRLKVSADYLWQEITYAFFSGNTDQWVQQWSVGAAYQYDFLGYNYAPQFDLSAYYAHAPSKNLSTHVGTFVNSFGTPLAFVDQRRIAGSSDGGIAPGLSAALWDGGRVGLVLNYDDVDYDQVNSTPNQDAKGFGGTITLKQVLGDNMDLNLAAGIRKPFNLYSANLGWNHVQFYGDWRLGVFGDYVAGKETLPNTWNLGFSADYMLDSRCPVPVRNLKGDLKGEHMAPITDNLLAWTADPAVYIPQVLAIADGKTTLACADGAAPTFPTAIDPDQRTISGTGTINFGPLFTGSNLIFSIVSISPALQPGQTISITPSGVLTFDSTTNHIVVVRATNACGTAVSNAFVVGSLPQ